MKVLQPLDISVNPANAPLITNSSTKVSNLNVDLLDGLDSTYFATKTEVNARALIIHNHISTDITDLTTGVSQMKSYFLAGW